jgi:hypothetical protein
MFVTNERRIVEGKRIPIDLLEALMENHAIRGNMWISREDARKQHIAMSQDKERTVMLLELGDLYWTRGYRLGFTSPTQAIHRLPDNALAWMEVSHDMNGIQKFKLAYAYHLPMRVSIHPADVARNR